MTIFYAGIGSRVTPPEVLATMENLGNALAIRGIVLRSGGAPGADSAFEKGCLAAGHSDRMEIYLPWTGFQGKSHFKKGYLCMEVKDPKKNLEARIIAAKHHPAPERLDQAGQRLHTRNVFQILGQDLNTPVKFVVCWSPGSGGTEGALRIASDRGIPIFNLFDQDALERLKAFLEAA